MKRLLQAFAFVGIFVSIAVAQDFNLVGHATYDPTDSSAAWFGTSGSRGVTAGADLDNDGKQEIYAAHYGHGGGVVGFEENNGVLEQIWNSDTTTTTTYSSGTRIVQTGDLDGDGEGEVIFFRGAYNSDPNAGLYIYEADGTDNGFKDPVVFNLNGLGFNFNGRTDNLTMLRVEYFVVEDIDGDGTQELVLASNGPSWVTDMIDTTATDTIEYGHSEDLFAVLSASGDLQSGLGSMNVEFVTSARDIDMGTVGPDNPLFGYDARLGSGSAIFPAITDMDGDGMKEILCHAWNHFNNFFVEATGPDTYSFGDTTNVNVTADDQVSLMNAAVTDMNHDGKTEAYLTNYYTGDVYKFEDNDGDATHFDTTEVHLIGSAVRGYFGATAYDFNGDGTDEVYFGSSATATDGDMLMYDGSSFTPFTTDTTQDAGFVAKMDVADLDGDGNMELVTGLQSVPDSVDVIQGTDTTTVSNPHNWIVRVLEYGDNSFTAIKDYKVVTPKDFHLAQAYPNPFNPSTNIEFSLPVQKEVSLTVYNMLGQKVVTLVNNRQLDAGKYKYTWDGKNSVGQQVASGTYIYTLKFGNYQKSHKVTFLK